MYGKELSHVLLKDAKNNNNLDAGYVSSESGTSSLQVYVLVLLL